MKRFISRLILTTALLGALFVLTRTARTFAQEGAAADSPLPAGALSHTPPRADLLPLPGQPLLLKLR